MKKLALAAVLTMAGTSVFAGGMAEPVMEPEPVTTKAASSSAGGIVFRCWYCCSLLLQQVTDRLDFAPDALGCPA